MDTTIKNEPKLSLLGRIVIFSIPLMLTGFLNLFYSAADLIVVGKFAGELSDISLAAVGANSSLISLIFNVFFGLSVGANIVMANAFGEKNVEKGQRVLHSSIVLSLICSLIIGVVCFIFAEDFLILTKCDKEVLPYATLYLRIYLLGAPGNLLFNFAQSNLRAVGNTKTPLIILLLSGLLNVLLNFIFVIAFHMAVAGVALATIASQYASAIAIMIYLIKSKDEFCHFSFKKIKISPQETKELILHGLPAGIQGSVFSLSNVVIQSAVNSFGPSVMSGKSAAFSIDNFVYTAMNTFYTACIVFVGQGYGAKNIKKMKDTFWLCQFCVFASYLIFAGLILIFNKQLISLYTSNEESIKACQDIMFVVLPFYFLCGMNEVSCGMLRSLKHPLLPTFVSLGAICGTRMIWIYTIFRLNKTVSTLFLSYLVSWIIAFSIHTILYFVLRKKSFEKCLNGDN